MINSAIYPRGSRKPIEERNANGNIIYQRDTFDSSECQLEPRYKIVAIDRYVDQLVIHDTRTGNIDYLDKMFKG